MVDEEYFNHTSDHHTFFYPSSILFVTCVSLKRFTLCPCLPDGLDLEQLSAACRLAAPSIGKDWKMVYLSLPFDPPRDSGRRQHDVEHLDLVCQRHDVTVDEQALHSLNKWRSFHRRGNINELIQTLREVRKKAVARQLQERFQVQQA